MRPSAHTAATAALSLLALVPACGVDLLGDYTPGGATALPIAGAGPYAPLPASLDTPAEEPIVLADRQAHLSDPAVLRGADGGFRVWFGRAAVGAEGASAIGFAELPALGAMPLAAPVVALAADAAWEAGAVARPSLVDLGGGHLVLYYEGGGPTPAIGRADSTDDGKSWRKDPGNPVLAGAADPAAVALDGHILLYVSVPGEAAISVATSDDADGGGPFAIGEVVLAARPERAGAYDADGLASPVAVAVATLDPRAPSRIALLTAGTRTVGGEPVTSIGFAGSFDGASFERGGEGDGAVLDPEPPSEGGPAVVLEPTRAVLFFHLEARGRRAIAAAVDG